MDIDATMLARIQFAFTVTFHIIFPAFTIGLSAFITTLLGRWLYTGDEHYRTLARFWTKIFAVSFAMGVVSGIVLSYQFGTNWSRFSSVVGNTIGPLIGYEVLTAFFLEATFLGIMLFGWNRVPPALHFFAALMVAVGTCMSAFWILSANSWMQFPTGHEVRDGIAYPVDWLAIVFSPTFPLRLAHMVAAAYLTTAIVVLAVGARYLLAGVHERHGRTMIGMGLGMTLILAPLQAVIGDAHGLKTAEYQPVKLAAIEGHWPEREVAPLVLFGWPNERTETNDFQIAIPHLGSLIITHDWNGVYPGLKAFPPEDRPPVAPVFFSFRVMVGLGFFMIGLAFWGGYLWLRGQLFTSRPFLRIASWSWPTGFVAIIAGWFVAEIGRQPWVATGILRTVDASSPVAPATVAVTLALFVVVYGIVFTMGIRYINRLIVKGPAPEVAVEPKGLPNRPLSAAEEAARAAMQPGP
ncbi:cytochrome ubiquinol oxidase subunit I [Chelatococcus composti]|jgi:cytochrome d ubiquinol oxidase subunit I|uniref:Cytochrome d ubiquinol oxidase subunit I n=1 Tax=Chelatococcus composti TaxID=1743235 RepID=A0A841KEZ7_9HYPH|nr:cytochrome ubiquinol oxidase subunit I [Chelatococcus composti]MBB6168506.1 cytochrome d ubiquinol oxidase subunit I [Chelatococcus composti]MBS7736415.1 cytochrome ubiquinol oxidase subunit I [Chelatococcus composti]PZN39777.1 MAG: cytochrome ubiquinol oxidase subunit I [Pseudomonadota bacterium]GGG40580.1 cytochrome ubiquinol oxidase subunit I [Chelatococcus composti]